MDLYRREVQDVIWDDRWKAQRQIVNHSGGYLAQVQGKWLLKTTPVRTGEATAQYSFAQEDLTKLTLPDHVFEQCNIQFRLVRHQELELDREHVEFLGSYPDGSVYKVCNDYERKLRYLHILDKALDADSRFDEKLPIVVFNYASQAAGCSPKSADSACPPGVCLSAGAVFYGYINANGEKNADLILSHELGHVLDLDDEDCSQRSAAKPKELMCGTVGGLSTFIPNSKCAAARAQAKKYMDHYAGVRSP